jgi:DNA-binding MarR family transcriptional regulator
MGKKLEGQARELHRALEEMIRRYQFRDRQEICCHGISVSQCYALSALEGGGQLNMGDLAGRMRLTVSTMTRIVDQLVKRKLVERCTDPEDRRVCCVRLTGEGQELLETIRGELLEMEEGVLEKIEPAQRQGVIEAVRLLTQAVDQWREKHGGACC